MNFKQITLMLSSAALLGACSQTVTNVNDEAKTKGNITLQMVDASTQAGVAAAKVYSVTDDETVTSDSSGLVVLKNNVIGDYAFIISADKYVSRRMVVSLAEQGQGDVARVPDVYSTVQMYKKGVKATGSLFYYDAESSSKKVASGVTVYASFGSNFVPSEVSTQTDKNGIYTFENLPEGVDVTISFAQTTFGKLAYGTTSYRSVSGLRVGEETNLTAVLMEQVAGEVFLVSDNTNSIDSTTTIALTFSQVLAKDSIADHWMVTKGSTSSSYKVLTTVSLDESKKVVTIKPYSGKWETGYTYYISGTAYATDGAYATVSSKSFKVGGTASDIPSQVKNLTVEEYDGSYYDITLSWDAPEDDFSGYHLYYKTSEMSDYSYYGSIYDDYTSKSYDLSDFGYDYTSISFILLPYNENGVEAELEKAKAVTYKVPTVTIDEE